MQRLGEKLRTLRERRGLSLRQLAVELGVNHSHIGHIESGKNLPSLELFVALAAYFDVSLDVLVDDDRELRLK